MAYSFLFQRQNCMIYFNCCFYCALCEFINQTDKATGFGSSEKSEKGKEVMFETFFFLFSLISLEVAAL